jgi:hypothetical protein
MWAWLSNAQGMSFFSAMPLSPQFPEITSTPCCPPSSGLLHPAGQWWTQGWGGAQWQSTYLVCTGPGSLPIPTDKNNGQSEALVVVSVCASLLGDTVAPRTYMIVSLKDSGR